MATVTALRKPKVTVGSLIDSLSDIRQEKRDLAVKEKEINARYEAVEKQLLELMDAEGLSKSTGRNATASVSETIQFNTSGEGADWNLFCAYMSKTKQFHLIQRRVSAPALRELWGKKGPVPGLTQYTKREIGLRDL